MKHALCTQKVEVYMGSDTANVIDTLFNTLSQNSVEVLEYEFHKIDIIRAESYIIARDWIASKKATINPKN